MTAVYASGPVQHERAYIAKAAYVVGRDRFLFTDGILIERKASKLALKDQLERSIAGEGA